MLCLTSKNETKNVKDKSKCSSNRSCNKRCRNNNRKLMKLTLKDKNKSNSLIRISLIVKREMTLKLSRRRLAKTSLTIYLQNLQLLSNKKALIQITRVIRQELVRTEMGREEVQTNNLHLLWLHQLQVQLKEQKLPIKK